LNLGRAITPWNACFLLWERERERERDGGKGREREREQAPARERRWWKIQSATAKLELLSKSESQLSGEWSGTTERKSCLPYLIHYCSSFCCYCSSRVPTMDKVFCCLSKTTTTKKKKKKKKKNTYHLPISGTFVLTEIVCEFFFCIKNCMLFEI